MFAQKRNDGAQGGHLEDEEVKKLWKKVKEIVFESMRRKAIKKITNAWTPTWYLKRD